MNLKKLLENTQPDASRGPWLIVRLVNLLGLLAIVIIIAAIALQDVPPGDYFPVLALLVVSQLLTANAIHNRADKIEQLIVEIDKENDKRDDANYAHIEVVLQDVQYLIVEHLKTKGEKLSEYQAQVQAERELKAVRRTIDGDR